MIIPQNKDQDQIRENSRNYSVPASGIFSSRLNVEGSSMNINLEENIESSIVQVYAKKANLKRRKINVFKKDNFLQD